MVDQDYISLLRRLIADTDIRRYTGIQFRAAARHPLFFRAIIFLDGIKIAGFQIRVEKTTPL